MQAVQFDEAPGAEPPIVRKTAGFARKILWLVALAVGGSLYGMIRWDLGNDIPYVLGQCTGSALLVWVVFHFLAARRRGRWFSPLAFLVIFVSITAGSFLNLAVKRVAVAQMGARIQEILNAIAEADAAGLPPPRIALEPVATGDLGEMERVIRTILNRMMVEREEYQHSMDAIGWVRILDPQRVANDSTMAESRRMIRQAKDAVETYKERLRVLPERTRADVANLSMGASAKREFLVGFERGINESGFRTKQQLELESQTIDEFGKIIELLAETRGQWTVQGGQFSFADGEALARFQARLEEIDNIGHRQETLQKELLDAAASQFQKVTK